jgi:glucose dehydrogenase
MPFYQDKLSPQQVNDIVRYLASVPPPESGRGSPSAHATYERILHAEREPQNWLTYGGSYASQRYSPLTEITRGNVANLRLKWVWRPSQSWRQSLL